MSEPSSELMVTRAIWAWAFSSICSHVLLICAAVFESRTCAKSLTYPAGCNCETDSARDDRPGDKIKTAARHQLVRQFTCELYRTKAKPLCQRGVVSHAAAPVYSRTQAHFTLVICKKLKQQ